jgi:3'-phosphoadenosine 5'-phosphosulfate sulfotransferase (PAPS reductase)/FAD synthetase
LDIAKSYSEFVQPIKVGKKYENTRANKTTRYSHFNIHKEATLAEKERWSIELIKMALQRVSKPAVSCSFGIDSIVDIFLTRKALVELGKDPSDIDIVWNDTANKFKEIRKYLKEITEAWNLRLIITKPKEDFDLLIVGLRAAESIQWLQDGLRNGEFFYSRVGWKTYVSRPILWWKEYDIWDYVEQENIPYNDLYRMNLIQEYPANTEEIVFAFKEVIEKYGLNYYDLGDRQTLTVNRKQAMLLESIGFKVFTPSC